MPRNSRSRSASSSSGSTDGRGTRGTRGRVRNLVSRAFKSARAVFRR